MRINLYIASQHNADIYMYVCINICSMYPQTRKIEFQSIQVHSLDLRKKYCSLVGVCPALEKT